jgi:hypothetical protein
MLTVGTTFIPFKAIVAVDVDAAVLEIAMLVTIAVLPDGVVYRVVPVLVVAAPLKRALLTVAIIYYLSVVVISKHP